MELEKAILTVMHLLTLPVVFMTVDHNILLNKLSSYGKKTKCLKWFSSYLLQRKQHVQTSTLKTASLNVVCGVSQGFTLSLLLFILYTNDLCKVSDILKPVMFADNTNLFFSHKSMKELFHPSDVN